jgi:hypothetical protein
MKNERCKERERERERKVEKKEGRKETMNECILYLICGVAVPADLSV